MSRLSVILLAYRRHPLTVRNVEEILKSSRLPDELIVVNDGGDPILKEMLLPLRPFKTKVIYARVNEDIVWNYVGAANLGFWLSTGDYFILQDTDHIPDRDVYEKGIHVLDVHPDTSRVAFGRKVVDISELEKPMEDWKIKNLWGANQMVSMFRRDVYLKIKGQDERFAGNYGWMTYDFVNKTRNILKIGTEKVNYFYAITGDEGEPGMKRGLSAANHRIYRENGVAERLQHKGGILNFTYTHEIL